jgi:hypothetical protein
MNDLALQLPPTNPQLFVGIAGVVLLFAGARLYRLAVVTTGFVGGAVLGLQLSGHVEAQVLTISVVCMGIIGAFIMHMAERLAFALIGAMVAAALAHAIWPSIMPGEVPFYVPTAAGIVGMVVVPRLFTALLPLFTTVLGAFCIAWALGDPGDWRILGPVVVVGLLGQAALGGSTRRS